ncbi:MAG: GNAT family N-acetyltransferase [Clostridia bacterium]|nr:GNAT family N-acetyltransferase [Clostridia bacterium]
MNLIFRKVDPCIDLEQFGALMDDLSERAFDNEKVANLIEKNNSNEDVYLMVAENTDNHELVGSLIGVLFDDYCGECKKILVVENVVTSNRYRRMGVARAMFEHIEKWGHDNNAHYVILGSAMHRHEAHKFYENIGYQEIKGFKKYI